MSMQHENLAAGRWTSFSFAEQMANIGSEVGRTIKWKNKENKEFSGRAFGRALELLELTIADRCRLGELTRLWEVLVDYFVYDNEFASSDALWQKYFYYFNYEARGNR